MGQHLKVVDPVITPQHTDESPDNVREEGGIKPGLEAGQRRLVGAGPHIRGEDIQLSGKGFAGVLLVVLDHAQHIPADSQLLCDGGHKPGQLRLDLVPLDRELFLRPTNLLEIDRHRQKNDYQCQQREDQQAWDHRQEHRAGLDHGKGGVFLRGHVQPSGGQCVSQAPALVLIHVDVRSQSDRPAHEQGFHTLGLFFLLAAY